MRTTMIICALALIGSVSAQDRSTMDMDQAHANSCMMMSDSMSTALGLSAEQVHQVKDADARCMKASEAGGHRSGGKMDNAAMRDHATDMKDILDTEQYARWRAICSTDKAQGNTPAPRQ